MTRLATSVIGIAPASDIDHFNTERGMLLQSAKWALSCAIAAIVRLSQSGQRIFER